MENWVPVKGWKGLYEVSDEGRVRSLPRAVTHYTGKVLRRTGRLLKGCITHRGYVKVTLCRDGKAMGAHVHALVAEAFIGDRPPRHIVRHLDGCTTNNTAKNLAWGTSAENSADMEAHGTVLRGETHARARLTNTDVLRIRALHHVKTYTELATEYGISTAQVYNILSRKLWRHI